MTKRKARAKRSPKPSGALRQATATSAARVNRSKDRADDVTARLNALYSARPEDSAVDPLLSELQFRSLRDKW